MIRSLTDIKAFFEIHKDSKEFQEKAKNNFELRGFCGSFGFAGTRDVAAELIKMNDGQRRRAMVIPQTWPTLPRSHKAAIDQAFNMIFEIRAKALPGMLKTPDCFAFEIELDEGVEIISSGDGCVTLSVEKTEFIGRAAYKYWVSTHCVDDAEDFEFRSKYDACKEFVLYQMKNSLNQARI